MHIVSGLVALMLLLHIYCGEHITVVEVKDCMCVEMELHQSHTLQNIKRGSLGKKLAKSQCRSYCIARYLVWSRDVVSVLNVLVSRRPRDIFWNVSSRLGLEG